MNYRIVLNLMGRIMIVEALFMLPPLAIAVYCGEWRTDAWMPQLL